MATVPTDPLMTVATVAALFDVKPATIREWLKDGTLRGVKIGKGHYWRVPQSAAIELANRKYGDDDTQG